MTTPAAQAGYIVVETNYRVYAYTDSNLQVALLGLFTELLYRYFYFILTICLFNHFIDIVFCLSIDFPI